LIKKCGIFDKLVRNIKYGHAINPYVHTINMDGESEESDDKER
jgi:hypothetical protein